MEAYAIGIDLGGTKIAGALVTPEGTVVAQERVPTLAEQGVAPAVERVLDCIERLHRRADRPIAGIGIGAAGMVDSRRGIVIGASNLKWTNVPLRDLIAERLPAGGVKDIVVDKDTNGAVLGEMMYGAGRGSRHLLYVTVGTGVGGGMILDGRLYHGATEGASDLGHLVLDPHGPVCGCGKRGCLEALASGPAIARQAQEALRRGTTSSLSALNIAALTAVEVVEAAGRADPLARSIVTGAGVALGTALAWYVDINNPDRIVIGGGVALAGDLLLEPVRQTIAERALPENVQAVRILPAGLGTESGAIGAAALVWHQLEHPN